MSEAMKLAQLDRTRYIGGSNVAAIMGLGAYEQTPLSVYLIKTGATIEESALWPTPDYPAVPLLLEYAGNDRTGRGHNRSNDIYLLWRYERESGRWVALLKCTGQGTDWIAPVKQRALAELARTAPPLSCTHASDVCVRVLAALDHELELLDTVNRHLVMSFVYQEFSARAVAYAA